MATLVLMRYEIGLHPAALQMPAVRHMKLHNQWAETVRLCVQLLAVGVGVGVLVDVLPSIAVAWVLIAMNAATVGNSANELLLAARLILGTSGQMDVYQVHDQSKQEQPRERS